MVVVCNFHSRKFKVFGTDLFVRSGDIYFAYSDNTYSVMLLIQQRRVMYVVQSG